MTCHLRHHKGCGCPECIGNIEHKKKIFMAMVFFGMMALFNAMIVGIIHLKLHAKELFMKE